MDFGGTNVKAGVFDHEGDVVVFETRPLTAFSESGDVVENLVRHAEMLVSGYPITGGGFATKGLVDTRAGSMMGDIGAGSLLAGRNLRDAFSSRLNVPFAIENDARAYAWGEYSFGAGRESNVMVCMTLGTGLGCALVAYDKPYEGTDPLGGVLGGHISIDRTGIECPCGQRGCLEQYCSATAIAGRVTTKHPELSGEDTLPIFFDMVRTSERTYMETLNEVIDDLAIGVVNVIHAYGPDTVVLGGGVMRSGELILPRLRELVSRRAWTIPKGRVRLQAAELDNRGAALGVAFHPALDESIQRSRIRN
jgi:glucokinase